MRASIQAQTMIKNFESLKLKSYKCVPTEKFYTIGYGHYGVGKDLIITTHQADEFLLQDIEHAERAVNKYDSLYRFNQNQYDALVSFAFNIGSITQLTSSGKRTEDEIGECILLYVKSGGKTLKGLQKRRAAEHMLYTTPTAHESKTASQLAEEVIAGKWGDGAARKVRLESYGYNYNDVQAAVNKLLAQA